MADNLVTLEIQFAAAADDDSARLFWVDGANEQGYGRVQLRASVRQATFPAASKWRLGGATAGRHGLLGLHRKARGRPWHLGGEAQRLGSLRQPVALEPGRFQVAVSAAFDHPVAAQESGARRD